MNKYEVKIKNKMCQDMVIDVYDVLVAFNVTNPATAHAVKKLLKAGDRGYKSKIQDYTEAMSSLCRAVDLEGTTCM